MTPPDAVDTARVVLTEVARADRRRRARESVRVLAGIAPIGSAVALIAAAVGRWLGWRPLLPLGLLAILALGLAIWVLIARRLRPTSDITAARVDAEAGLGGELRSAHWFAAARDTAPWPQFHLARAAARLSDVSWDQVYPPVRAHRAWATTGLCVVASLALSYRVPPAVKASSPADAAMEANMNPGVMLTPEMAKRLQDLLSKAQAGALSPEEAKKLAELTNLFKKIDPNADPKLADLMKKLEDAAKDASKQLAEGEKGEGSPDDLKAAMEDLASKLAKGDAERAGNQAEKAPNSDEKQFGKSNAAGAQAKSVQASVQMVREAATDAGQQMTPAGGAQGGDSAGGRGGNNDQKGGGQLLKLQADALRKELVEASADMAGQNVTKEDLRRKTEQGKSTLSYTHVAQAAVDKGRAVPPPPVPDARKALVQSYFIRKQ